MLAFYCLVSASVHYGSFQRRYLVNDNADAPSVDKLYVYTSGEVQLIRAYYNKVCCSTDPDISSKPDIRTVTETDLLKWPHFPARLGRKSAKLLGDALSLVDSPAPLEDQCRTLLLKNPGRRHFRIVVLNAFGTNLGDTMMGMTAMRVASEVFSKVFESFEIDLVLGLQSGPARQYLCGSEPWLGRLYLEAPTVQDMARYDAYLDFTDPINQPRFSEMPTIDLYLWWMGLDPNEVSAHRKRNITTINPTDWEFVSNLLACQPKGTKVLFNPQASVALRSCEPDVANEIVLALLETDRNITIVLDRPLAITHERVLDLSTSINSPGTFQALVCQVDGLISVDTFSLHVADCASIPTVLVSASVPPEFFPYYPATGLMEIPGARALPQWGKTKVTSDEAWEKDRHAYREAWSQLDVSKVVAELKSMRKKRSGLTNPLAGVRISTVTPLRPTFKEVNGYCQFHHVSVSDGWPQTIRYFADISRGFAKRGHTAITVTVADSTVMCSLSQKLGELGHLHLFEPRPLWRALLSSNILKHSDLTQLQSYAGVPTIASSKNAWISDVDPFSEVFPHRWGNLQRRSMVSVLALDEYDFQHCDLVLIMPPSIPTDVMLGMRQTAKRCSPVILLGPIDLTEVEVLQQRILDWGYTLWTAPVSSQSMPNKFAVVAAPTNVRVQVTPFQAYAAKGIVL